MIYRTKHFVDGFGKKIHALVIRDFVDGCLYVFVEPEFNKKERFDINQESEAIKRADEMLSEYNQIHHR